MFHDRCFCVRDPPNVATSKIDNTSIKNRAGRGLPRHNFRIARPLALVLLLLVLAVASTSCVLLANADSEAISNGLKKNSRHSHRRQLQQPSEDWGETLYKATSNNNITTASESLYHPCSLCQGLTVLSDKIPFPQNKPNVTCADLNDNFLDHSGETIGTNDQHGCRSTEDFVRAFSECCRASIPTFMCEQNVHDYIDQGIGLYGKMNPVVAPIVDSDHQLNVSVYLEFELIEDINDQEGR